MSSLTGATAGGGSGGRKLKLKLGGAGAGAGAGAAAPGAAAAALGAAAAALGAAAPAMSTGTVGGSSASGLKLRIKLGGAAAGQSSQLSGASSPAAAAGLAAGPGAPSPGQAAQQPSAAAQLPSQPDPQLQQQHQQQLDAGAQQQQYYDAAAMQQQQQQYPYDAAAWQQQQQYMQYDPSMMQQQYDPSMMQYNPSMQQQYDMQYVQQYEQYQQQQAANKLKLQTKAKLGFAAASAQETRYTTTGRVQRAASKGIARLIAEEGGVPQDHSLAAPPPNARCAAEACLCAACMLAPALVSLHHQEQLHVVTGLQCAFAALQQWTCLPSTQRASAEHFADGACVACAAAGTWSGMLVAT